MKNHKLKIFHYLLFLIYLTSINVHPFFHHHLEGHDEYSDTLHTHLIDDSIGEENTDHTEFHSAQNNYFDENHILNSSGFILSNTIIILSYQAIEITNQEQNSFTELTTQSERKISRDKYVLTEANLPPPIS